MKPKSMTWAEESEAFFPRITEGETCEAIDRISAAIRSLPASPFCKVLDLEFTNEPRAIAEEFTTFIRKQESQFQIRAVYTETNGFDINPDRWYFDLFAYKKYGGHDDYDWLAYWDSEEVPGVTLTGMEALQQVYASPACGEPGYQDSVMLCSFLVVAKFQDLVRRARPMIRSFTGPILATSHDYEHIAEFRLKKSAVEQVAGQQEG